MIVVEFLITLAVGIVKPRDRLLNNESDPDWISLEKAMCFSVDTA